MDQGGDRGDDPPKQGRAPIYAFVVPHLVPRARALGYALAVHGSLARDLDLVAVPWTEEAATAEELVAALMLALGWSEQDRSNPPIEKPHGRRCWVLPLHGGLYIDLSVMPRGPCAGEPLAIHAARPLDGEP